MSIISSPLRTRAAGPSRVSRGRQAVLAVGLVCAFFNSSLMMGLAHAHHRSCATAVVKHATILWQLDRGYFRPHASGFRVSRGRSLKIYDCRDRRVDSFGRLQFACKILPGTNAGLPDGISFVNRADLHLPEPNSSVGCGSKFRDPYLAIAASSTNAPIRQTPDVSPPVPGSSVIGAQHQRETAQQGRADRILQAVFCALTPAARWQAIDGQLRAEAKRVEAGLTKVWRDADLTRGTAAKALAASYQVQADRAKAELRTRLNALTISLCPSGRARSALTPRQRSSDDRSIQ